MPPPLLLPRALATSLFTLSSPTRHPLFHRFSSHSFSHCHSLFRWSSPPPSFLFLPFLCSPSCRSFICLSYSFASSHPSLLPSLSVLSFPLPSTFCHSSICLSSASTFSSRLPVLRSLSVRLPPPSFPYIFLPPFTSLRSPHSAPPKGEGLARRGEEGEGKRAPQCQCCYLKLSRQSATNLPYPHTLPRLP